jgi:2-oxoglutarate dehydrogenase E1 component
MVRKYRVPLIVMTPKSLLRHPGVGVDLKTLTHGSFQVVIPDLKKPVTKKVTRVVICSGKIYYALDEVRTEQNLEHIALIRIEQLYPFPLEATQAVLSRFTLAKTLVWCQEEPKNQGAWYSCRHHFEACLLEGQQLLYAGREAMAAPASGYKSVYAKAQKKVIEQALNVDLSTKESV